MPKSLPQISPASWEHSTDRAALGALQTIPGFDTLLRKVIGMFDERNIRLNYQARSLKVSPSQYRDIYETVDEVCVTLDADVPELYISQTPLANSGAIGVEKPFIVLNSSLVELSTPEQLKFAIGHEVGHILSDHTLYRTLLFLLLDFARPMVPVIGQASYPITLALLEWHRKAEISCDRAGLLAVQDLNSAFGALGVVAGGIRGRRDTIDIPAMRAQAADYVTASGLDGIYKFMATMRETHPFPMVRVAELGNFVDSSYEAILNDDYVRRGEEPHLIEDLDEARKGFSDSAQQVFSNADKYVNRTLLGWAEAVNRRIETGDAESPADGEMPESGEPGDEADDADEDNYI